VSQAGRLDQIVQLQDNDLPHHGRSSCPQAGPTGQRKVQLQVRLTGTLVDLERLLRSMVEMHVQVEGDLE
jgi:hypothetical protein